MISFLQYDRLGVVRITYVFTVKMEVVGWGSPFFTVKMEAVILDTLVFTVKMEVSMLAAFSPGDVTSPLPW